MKCANCGAEVEPGQACASCQTTAPINSQKSKLTAALLCFFLGAIGVHRFYVGKIGTGIVWIITLGGGFGIGTLVDFIMILCGKFKDKQGLYLK